MGKPDYETYEEGLEAAMAGKLVADCPYRYGSLEYESWTKGFDSWIEDDE